MSKRNVVGFNLTQEEIEKLDEICQKTGLKRVELFRQRVLEQDTISKQFAGLTHDLETQLSEAITSLDNSIEWNIEQNLEKLDTKFSNKFNPIFEKLESKVDDIESRIVKQVVSSLKDLTSF